MDQSAPICGVSVIICCHNGATRLPPTLAHLLAQKVRADLPWEVIVVDNVSTDGTAELAQRLWLASAPAPLRVLRESQLGKMHAFRLGCTHARYDVLSFLDDDNWVDPDWVESVYRVLQEHPEVGACGGYNEPVFETPPPPWFKTQYHCFALGAQAPEAGDITWTRGYLWGAGMTLRRQAWKDLDDNGFRSRLTCRRGDQLSSGGDSEICAALRLAGWTLWCDPQMRLRHFVPSNRLSWSHVRQLYQSFGESMVTLEAYEMARVSPEGKTQLADFWGCWRRLLARICLRLISHPRQWVAALWAFEGSTAALEAGFSLSEASELLRQRSKFDRAVFEVFTASWKRSGVNRHSTLRHAEAAKCDPRRTLSKT